jgi:hypothetical protein
MGIRDTLAGAGRALAGIAGTVLLDAADGEGLFKADERDTGEMDEGQDRSPGGDREDTVQNAPVPTEPAQDDPKALFWDPFAVVEQLGYKDRPSSITYGTLKSMVYRTPVINAIIQTRVQQVAAFAKPSQDRYDLGFRIKMREKDKEPTKAERDWMLQMQSIMMRTGVTEHPRGRDGFEVFLRKLVWDSLTYDQMTFEVVPNKKGQPAEWYAVDASTIRLADSASTYIDEDLDEITRYVQIYDSMVIAEYNQNELCFAVRNPRTDIRLFGYGVSELEMLINTVTSMLWAWEYNQRAFSQGSVHKGILNFKGAIPDKQLRQFRRQWYQQLSGVQNAWRTPITNADELQWVNMHQSNRDMEYSAWMDFLIKTACSMYLIDPVEVNFKYGNTGQSGGLQEASNKEKIIESKERGLRPLLRFVERCINQFIIWPISEDFEFAFVGLDQGTRDQVAELNQKLVKTTRTVNELRAEDDLPPLEWGDVILDPQAMQAVQLAANAGQEEGGEGGDDFSSLLAGFEDEDGDGDDDDDDEGKKPEPEREDAGDDNQPAKPVKPAGKSEQTEKSMRPVRGRYMIDINL